MSCGIRFIAATVMQICLSRISCFGAHGELDGCVHSSAECLGEQVLRVKLNKKATCVDTLPLPLHCTNRLSGFIFWNTDGKWNFLTHSLMPGPVLLLPNYPLGHHACYGRQEETYHDFHSWALADGIECGGGKAVGERDEEGEEGFDFDEEENEHQGGVHDTEVNKLVFVVLHFVLFVVRIR